MPGQFSVGWKRDLRKKVQEQVRAAAMSGVKDAAETLLTEANQTAPHSKGPLRLSGTVSTDEQKIAAAVSYDTPYAVRQHEDTRLRHPDPTNPLSDPRGRAKWLQLTLQERQAALQQYIAAAVKRVTG